jgi:hypothetical protein
MTTVQILATVYNPEIEQECKLGAIVYRHYPNGEWFIDDAKSYNSNPP